MIIGIENIMFLYDNEVAFYVQYSFSEGQHGFGYSRSRKLTVLRRARRSCQIVHIAQNYQI